eukprot:4334299-Prymnesium_polylepis.1
MLLPPCPGSAPWAAHTCTDGHAETHMRQSVDWAWSWAWSVHWGRPAGAARVQRRRGGLRSSRRARLKRASSARSRYLPLEVPAHAVRALPEEAQDVHVGLDARLRVVCIRAVAVPVDVAVPAEQRRRRLGEVGRNPVLVGAAVPLAELPRRARVPVAVASPPPPRVIEEVPAVALGGQVRQS